MGPLRWSWAVRFGPYARGTVGSQPWLLLAVPLVGVGVALLTPREWTLGMHVVAGVVVAVLAVAFFLSALNRQLRRRRRTVRGQTQTYALDADALVISVGKDSYSLPTAELRVSAHGRDWVAVRRQGTGRRPLLLFVDDPGLVAPIRAVLVEAADRM